MGRHLVMYCLAPQTQSHPPHAEPAPGNPSTSQDNVKHENDEIDIQIRNVVCNYSLPLHIDLRKVALNSGNVTFDRDRGVLYKQKRNPQCHVKVYSSGNVYIVGCRSEEDCRRAARSVGRMIQRSMGLLNAKLRLRDYKICNVLATCRLPFGVKIEEMAAKYKEAQYEPELSVGLVWKYVDPKASLRIHTTGSITITGATSAEGVMRAIQMIYPIVQEFRCSLRHRVERTTGPRKRVAAEQLPAEFAIARRPRLKPIAHNEGEEDDPHNSAAFNPFDDEEELYDELM
ncbi:unnamed protein product [Bursaphelenchus okinawaensis]|uniref:TATA box-binding protein-like 1 n=1 Tax=Bursaphelenchus okinawaensis TaxID=465554 RepID=A0A811JQS0_9BILA|nr:unnamed protein product [Bursaphelenchus okinawaensis]CAG9078706.1 unnamed protein product [Bursaphelenchus okinawaensis]